MHVCMFGILMCNDGFYDDYSSFYVSVCNRICCLFDTQKSEFVYHCITKQSKFMAVHSVWCFIWRRLPLDSLESWWKSESYLMNNKGCIHLRYNDLLSAFCIHTYICICMYECILFLNKYRASLSLFIYIKIFSLISCLLIYYIIRM